MLAQSSATELLAAENAGIGRHDVNAIEIRDPDTISRNQRQAVRHVTRRGRCVTSRIVDDMSSH